MAVLKPDDAGEDLALCGEDTDDRIRQGFRPGAVASEPIEICTSSLRVAHRQRAQHQRVDQAEDRGVGADAQRQREHDDQREPAIPGEHPDGVADVAPDLVEPAAVPRGADAFLGLLDAAKLEQREPARLAGDIAVAHLVGRRRVDEPLKLVIELPLGASRPKQPRRRTRDGAAASRALQHAGDRERDAVPSLPVLLELLPAGRGEPVVLGVAVVLARAATRP